MGTNKDKKAEIRISSGLYKGKKLISPKIEGFRSVQDKVKQAVFAIIENPNIENSFCLDLFSGSGIMGIEALSRKALFVDFVDSTYKSYKTIQDNLLKLEINEFLYEVHLIDAVKYVLKHAKDKKYNFIFADPFYADIKQKHLVDNISNILAKNGLFIYFHSPEFDPNTLIGNANLKEYTKRQFGNACFTMYTNI